MIKPLEQFTVDSFVFPICNNCKNKIDGLKCKAFDVIPDEIYDGENDHSKPLPGQKNDVIFEPKNKE
jgi:hypothetical protein